MKRKISYRGIISKNRGKIIVFDQNVIFYFEFIKKLIPLRSKKSTTKLNNLKISRNQIIKPNIRRKLNSK